MSSKEKEMEKIREARKKWEEGTLKKNLKRLGLEENPVELYTPLDLKDHSFLENVGFPGKFPFTAGRFAIPVLNALWGRGKTLGAGKAIRHAFGYSGYGTAEDMRDFYIERGKTPARGGGPNIAFDLPTQIGYDSDHELSEGEVGRVGVAVDTLKDFEIIYEPFTGDMELDKIASNWTINGTTNIILAMYIALAEKRGIPLDKLRGTPQNDILKEFVARGTQIFPVGPSMRMTRDTITYCTEHLPNMNTISICGYHMREAGATRVQAVAFAFANAMAYFQTVIDAGLDIDQFVGRTTFLNFGGGIEVLKEAACRRAARRVWAKIMRDRFGSKNPSHWIYKELGGGLSGYWTCTKQRPLNNLVRVAIGAVFSAMIGDPPILEPPFDEPLGLGHSVEARQLASDAARIIMEECRLADVQDALAGSYYVESLTDRYEKEIFELIQKIDEMGGAVKAVESGWMKDQVTQSALEYLNKMETGEVIQVGVNKYTEPDEIEVMTPRTSPYKIKRIEDAERRQIENLQEVKRQRDNRKVQSCLEKIENAARDEKVNLIPFFVDAVKEYATIGEICGVLRNVFGEAQ
ncbi:MAG: methylmalonyl-CoA mutase [Deltaproteobacteria bacterium]|nr:methylmalonyl-CoA mutase [Deltaproteobacteria bacterium]